MKQRSRSSSTFPHPAYLKAVLKPNFEHSIHHFLEPLIEINQAHAIMLSHCGIIARRQAAMLLRALRQVGNEQEKLKGYSYSAGLRRTFFSTWRAAWQVFVGLMFPAT